jgi:hypothetical protein
MKVGDQGNHPFSPGFAAEGAPAVKVSDLCWMSGNWEGAMNGYRLEENWTQPTAGSIACLARVTKGGATTMIEMILIEEEEGSLVARIQRWDPGYKPRTERPQVLSLVELGNNRVAFEAVSEGLLRRLDYRLEDKKFVIFGTLAQGEQVEARLTGK